MTRANRMALALVAAAAVASGCRADPSRAASDAGTPAPGEKAAAAGAAAAAPSRPARNACALVPREQVEAIAKEKLDMLHNIEEEDKTICELTSAATNTMLVSVTVYWRGGKELARVNRAATSMAKQMMNDDEVDIEELTGSEKVRGLADKAYYSDLMPSWVLKDDVLIEVISPRFGHDQTKSVFLAVAKQALSRL